MAEEKTLEEKIQTLSNMVMYIAKEQCKDDKLSESILTSIFLNVAQTAFEEMVENTVNEHQKPEGALNFIRVQMKIIQMWVEMANKAHEDIEKMTKKIEP